MSPAEIDAFLGSETSAVVVALAPDGPPPGTVASFAYDGGNVSVTIDPADPVCALLAADPRVCCVVERFPTYYEIAGVMLHGTARPRGGGAYDVEVARTVSFDFSKLRGAS
jgi:hypothetical protein